MTPSVQSLRTQYCKMFQTTLGIISVFAGGGFSSIGNAQTITMTTMTPATGVGFGFWENGFQDAALQSFGRRSFGRVGINSWNSIETKNSRINTCQTPDFTQYGSLA